MSEIIAGRRPIIEALKSGRPINRILLAQNIGRHSAVAEILRMSHDRRIPLEYVPRQALDDASPSDAHQGALAYAAVKDYVSLDDLFAISTSRNEPALYCILDGIEDPHNLGAILRCADGSGTHGVVIRARRAVGLTAAVARASAGAVEYVPVARVTNIAQTIETLQERRVLTVGIDPAGEVPYTEVDFTGPTAIVIGGEGKGIASLVRRSCDILASIPMRGRVNSLNASIAAALAMYEAIRQRGCRE